MVPAHCCEPCRGEDRLSEPSPSAPRTDLAREIRVLRPDIPIVLMSGYSGTQLHQRAQAVGIREVLRKPLQSKDIAECLGRVLR
jgi:CheY-like chemotaxis protein